VRRRLPVAAKIALLTAGTIADVPLSPISVATGAEFRSLLWPDTATVTSTSEHSPNLLETEAPMRPRLELEHGEGTGPRIFRRTRPLW
jgi:hypothetical protein